MPKFRTKNALFCYFWARIVRILDCQNCQILKQHHQIFLITKFREIMKMPEFGTKSALFGYFWLKMSYLCIFRLEFEKNIAIFDISVLEFVLLQSLVQI